MFFYCKYVLVTYHIYSGFIACLRNTSKCLNFFKKVNALESVLENR